VTTELHLLLPRSKAEADKAEALVRLGYPAVAPVLPEILEWMQDLNWPVAQVFQPLLASIGTALAPLVRDILVGNDDVWKYWVLNSVVRESPNLAAELQLDLCRIVRNPSVGELAEGVPEVASALLKASSSSSDA
jgi:hypothetical protein